MRQHQFESAVARATGESVRTIQLRGFSFVRLNSNDDPVCHGHRASSRPRPHSNRPGSTEEDLGLEIEI